LIGSAINDQVRQPNRKSAINTAITNQQSHDSCIIRPFMKCPKCGYLGFEPTDRCRNCGYDFSFSAGADDQFDRELTIRAEAHRVDPLQDLTVVGDQIPRDEHAVAGTVPSSMSHDRAVGRGGSPSRTPADLPLFRSRAPDDEPLITTPAPPRPPLSVRRATPEIRRVRTDPPRSGWSPSLDLRLDPADLTRRPAEQREPGLRGARFSDRPDGRPRDAAVVARFVAVVIDLLILGAIDTIVIYFTMQICGIAVEELSILPKVPLVAFLLVQNGGYLVAFTVGGQTLGKMAVDIRVVSADSDDTLDLGRACVRTGLWVLLAIPAGLGFLTTLFSRDHRGLHDRFAGTRVVRASA
jgi:uncharacterized RDD family membrane protein YckC